MLMPKPAHRLKKSCDDVRRTIQNFGRFTDGPWRAEQKLAALGAWSRAGHKFARGTEVRVMKIRAATDADRDAIWKIFHEVVAARRHICTRSSTCRAKRRWRYWFEADMRSYVAEDGRPCRGRLHFAA